MLFSCEAITPMARHVLLSQSADYLWFLNKKTSWLFQLVLFSCCYYKLCWKLF